MIRLKNKWLEALLGFLFVGLILIVVFVLRSDPPVNTGSQEDIYEVKGKVLSVDDTEIIHSGVASIGYQSVEVKIISGDYKGQTVVAMNNLIGQMDLDNIYKKEDVVMIALLIKDGGIKQAKTIDLYRQSWLLGLFVCFVIALLLYAGFIGLKALISFVCSLLIIWEVLIKGLLDGKDPIMLTIFTVVLLTAIIVFLVAGFTKKALSAFLGTVSGLSVTLVLTLFFGEKIGLYGMTQPYVQQLLISGYYDLNIREVFYSAIILGASGAAMDIAMDIATSMAEILKKKPDIELKELIESGFVIGKHVIGTMATTLLLAYSGGYLTLLMVFMAKGSSLSRIINLKVVSAEVMRTLVGSMGLVLVAPLTALVTGAILIGFRSKSDNPLVIEEKLHSVEVND